MFETFILTFRFRQIMFSVFTEVFTLKRSPMMKFHVSESIASLVPYKTGKPIAETKREYKVDEIYKLASNENPLGVSPSVKKALIQSLDELHRYPDPANYDLLGALEKSWGISRSLMTIGNGSNELIDLLIRIFCEPNQFILISDTAFVAYEVCARAARVGVIKTPITSDFRMDLKKMTEVLQNDPRASQIRVVFLPNPNNPTGTYVTTQEVDDFMKVAQTKPNLLVVFDEAYNEYVRAADYSSAQKFVGKNYQVAVIRTLSKAYGLAGLRVGVLAADPEVIDLVNRVRNPFNINSLAQVASVAALQDETYLRQSVELTWMGLDYFYRELEKMGLPYIPSQGNFVLFDTKRNVVEVNESLLKKGIILRPVMNYGLNTYLRMSVGLMTENQKAIQALKEVLAT